MKYQSVCSGGLAAVLMLLLPASPAAAAENSMDDLRGLRTRDSRFPIYNDNRLQMMVYSEEAERQNNLIITRNPVMDLIRPGADVDSIVSGKGTVIYPLGAPLQKVFTFWSGRLFSDGVISSVRADIDQERKKGAGTDKAFFRSPLVDIDGVGFEADYGNRTLWVKSDVSIVIRLNLSDPRSILESGKMPAKYEYMTLTSDTMNIDFKQNEITMLGNVKVIEDRAHITCEKMIVYLDGAPKPADGNRSETKADVLPGRDMRGVSRIICEKNVVITAPSQNGETRSGNADRVVYELNDGMIKMTGRDGERPTLRSNADWISGEEIIILRDEERVTIKRNCHMVFQRAAGRPGAAAAPANIAADRIAFDYRKNEGSFDGNVRVEDPEMDLECNSMQIKFLKPDAPKATAKAEPGGNNFMPDIKGDKLELSEINCSGAVKMVRHLATAGEPGQSASAERAHLDYICKVITLTGSQPTLTRGSDRLSGEELVIFLESERLRSRGDTQIVLCSATAATATAPARSEKTTITSDSSDLHFGGNKLIFKGNVQIRDPRMALDCDQLDIYLRDKNPGEPVKKGDENLQLDAGSSGSKVVEKVVCTGKVHGVDAKFKVDTDLLTLNFRQLPPGAKPETGMFQSSGTELTSILFDGNVRLEAKSDPAGAKPSPVGSLFAGMAAGSGGGSTVLTSDRGKIDLPGNLSEFHGKVKVVESRGTLDAQSLYLYSAQTNPAGGEPAKPVKPAKPNVDIDPFDSSLSSDVPERIAIGEDRELTKVIAEKDVVITRHLPAGQLQRAIGDRVVYDVAARNILLTGTPDKLAVLEDPIQGKMTGKSILLDLVTEGIKAEGGRPVLELQNIKGLDL
jgi:lipopolysaccharide export system protein LptA